MKNYLVFGSQKIGAVFKKVFPIGQLEEITESSFIEFIKSNQEDICQIRNQITMDSRFNEDLHYSKADLLDLACDAEAYGVEIPNSNALKMQTPRDMFSYIISRNITKHV